MAPDSGDRELEASDCFRRSLELLDQAGISNADVVLTLFEYASWENEQGRASAATELARQGQALATRLGADHLGDRYRHLIRDGD